MGVEPLNGVATARTTLGWLGSLALTLRMTCGPAGTATATAPENPSSAKVAIAMTALRMVPPTNERQAATVSVIAAHLAVVTVACHVHGFWASLGLRCEALLVRVEVGAGLVPVIALAEQIALPELVAEHVAISGAANSAGANPSVMVMSLLAGTVAGADRVRHRPVAGAAGPRASIVTTRSSSRSSPTPRQRTGPPALRIVHRQRRLGGAVGHRA